MSLKIAVIGGGITGLSAAFFLDRKIKEDGLDAEYVLFEAGDRLGGKISTDYTGGFVIENGPDSFLARKKSAAELGGQVGLNDSLVYNNATSAYIYSNGGLHPMPGGAIMGIPTQWSPFLATKILSPKAKARAAADLVLPRTKKGDGDRSLGEFFRSRLGNEVVDRLIEPLLSGIYAGDINDISLNATFPQFQKMEDKHRSLILGMKSSMAKAPGESREKSVKKRGMFQTYTGGLQSLVEKIAEELQDGSVKTGAALQNVTKSDAGYTLTFRDGSSECFDRVIVTTPHHVTASFFENDPAFDFLAEMPATSVATVAVAFDKSAVKEDIEGSGFLVPKGNGFTITACTWTHKKWNHTAPEGKILLRAYVGRPGEEEIVDRSDDEIIDVVMDDLNRIMKLEGRPSFHRITRWYDSMPQYLVGHRERVTGLKEHLNSSWPGVYVAGASFEGIGLPDCIDQGTRAAEEALSVIDAE
ncbi:protoporphyrinogen oxidase [Alteribacter natronophilus]|uniref:protoporphyrinogen oxidase n=1 Tax=Alteribacter natronophilus TaxID=2583810 RepID=UPI00110D7A26|nr:protoporphyrinogen oxidase [Alteribacter natronophilus]TMW73990.1 protoporphyrinogen oxidase [Alteribacter natronophilus]